MPFKITSSCYGKRSIRISKVAEDESGRSLQEACVDLIVHGQLEQSYRLGDNSKLVATDSMQNLVYALARERPIWPVEGYALSIAKHVLHIYDHFQQININVRHVGNRSIARHADSLGAGFVVTNDISRLATVDCIRGENPTVTTVASMSLTKVAGSQFAGFIRDSYTTLEDTTDRLLSVHAQIGWTYVNRSGNDFDRLFADITSLVLVQFSEHVSLSVQHTEYILATAILDKFTEINTVEIRMQNLPRPVHFFGRFDGDIGTRVFAAPLEPVGEIVLTLSRENVR